MMRSLSLPIAGTPLQRATLGPRRGVAAGSRSQLQVSASLFGKSGPAPRQSAAKGKALSAERKGAKPSPRSSPLAAVAQELAGGGTGKPPGGSGGGGGGGGGGDEGGNGKDVESALAAAGRKLDSFPADFAAALAAGRVGAASLATWFTLEKQPLFKFLLYRGGGGFRERLLGDPLFMSKLGIELGVGICTKLSAEKAKRAGNFVKEADFVVANVIMALFADFMLTWLPAPTLPLAPKLATSASALQKFLANCPSNAFQMCSGGRTFTLLQRSAAIARNGAKLFAVGTCASLVGTGFTNTLIAVRRAMNPDMPKNTEDMDIVRQSLAYGLYMSVSSNLRYQVLAGVIEERGIERILGHKYPLASTVASFVVRTGNTFIGSLLWVDFVRLLGLQKLKAEPAGKGGKKPAAAPKKAAPKAAPKAAAKGKAAGGKK